MACFWSDADSCVKVYQSWTLSGTFTQSDFIYLSFKSWCVQALRLEQITVCTAGGCLNLAKHIRKSLLNQQFEAFQCTFKLWSVVRPQYTCLHAWVYILSAMKNVVIYCYQNSVFWGEQLKDLFNIQLLYLLSVWYTKDFFFFFCLLSLLIPDILEWNTENVMKRFWFSHLIS